LQVLNQLKLPHTVEYENVTCLKDVYDSIHLMKIRGAPAIAIIAMLGVALEIQKQENIDFKVWLTDSLDYIGKSRPTAVTLFNAIDDLKKATKDAENETIPKIVLKEAEDYLKRDEEDNFKISSFGRDYILNHISKDSLQLLTHCNTGALATAKYGTALGIIRLLKDNIKQVYATESKKNKEKLTMFFSKTIQPRCTFDCI
jgi:methylthioribose-1-phosphate isomerase